MHLAKSARYHNFLGSLPYFFFVAFKNHIHSASFLINFLGGNVSEDRNRKFRNAEGVTEHDSVNACLSRNVKNFSRILIQWKIFERISKIFHGIKVRVKYLTLRDRRAVTESRRCHLLDIR